VSGKAAPSGEWLRAARTPARHGPIGMRPISGDVMASRYPGRRGRRRPRFTFPATTVWFEAWAEVARRFDVASRSSSRLGRTTAAAFHMTMDSTDAIAAAHAFPRATILGPYTTRAGLHFSESQDGPRPVLLRAGLGDRLRMPTAALGPPRAIEVA